MSSEAEWKEMWQLFDRPPRSGVLPIEKVRHCIRGLGRQYLDSELDALFEGGGGGGCAGTVTYAAYVEALQKPYAHPTCTLKEAFTAFDGKESGMFSEQQLFKCV